jgi:hypothetical protein
MYNPYNLLSPTSPEQIKHITKGSSILHNSLRECPRVSRKKPNLGRSPTGCRETADVNSHIPCPSPAAPMPPYAVALKSLSKQYGRRTARAQHGMCDLRLYTVDIVPRCQLLAEQNIALLKILVLHYDPV